jgi:hypothetical protein
MHAFLKILIARSLARSPLLPPGSNKAKAFSAVHGSQWQ